MKFIKTKIDKLYIIELDEFKDDRGSFARQFCKKKFDKQGITFDIKQCNISKNYRKNVLRGLHYQKYPYLEKKIVSCIKGSCFDVVVDLRKDSKTYLMYESFNLTENNNIALYIPENCAHGFLTLEDNTTIYYQLSEFFHEECYSGIRWNDPKINIKWPYCENIIINKRDSNYELL